VPYLTPEMQAAPRGSLSYGYDVVVGGTTYRWAPASFAATVGAGVQYGGRVKSTSDITRSAMSRSNDLESGEFAVTLVDKDKLVAGLVESTASLRGSPITAWLGAPSVDPTKWSKRFVGALTKPDFPEPGLATLRFGFRDTALRREALRVILGRHDWPHAADEGVIGKPAQIVLGKRNSRGQGDGGAVLCPCVDTQAFRFLWSRGWAFGPDADRVFSSKDRTVPISGWTVEYVTRGGRLYTLIKFASSPADAGGGALPQIYADGRGLDLTGTGAGALAENPVDLLRIVLVNFVFGDYKTGAFLSDSTAPISTAAFTTAKDFATKKGYKDSWLLDASATGGALLNNWCRSREARAYWNELGELAVRFDNHLLTAAQAAAAPLLIADARSVGGHVRYEHEDDSVTDQITGTYSGGLQTLTVMDPTIGALAATSIDMPVSPAYVY